jgi:LPXTG-motif cell wall-anchored protein
MSVQFSTASAEENPCYNGGEGIQPVECEPEPEVDLCQNLGGTQATIPDGLVSDGNGNCVTPPEAQPVDVCSNIAGIQETVPDGMVIDGERGCISPIEDQCPNLEGLQEFVPADMLVVDGNCVDPPAIDRCNNIDGDQDAAPDDHTELADGSCVMLGTNDPMPAPEIQAQGQSAPASLPKPSGELPHTGAEESILLAVIGFWLILTGSILHKIGTKSHTLQEEGVS